MMKATILELVVMVKGSVLVLEELQVAQVVESYLYVALDYPLIPLQYSHSHST